MKHPALRLFSALSGLACVVFATSAAAAPYINGQIQFVGGADLNNSLGSATAFTAFFGTLGTGDPQVRSGSTGTYSSVPGGTQAAFSLFTFNPAPVSVPALWSFTVGSTTYSFDATSVVIQTQTSSILNLEGNGLAHVTGFADTYGTWSITDTGTGPVFTFGNATQVPEPSSAAFLISGVVAFFVVRRARR
jgi:PEP-CTERM motif